MTYSDEIKDRVVQMYKDGVRGEVIAQDLGIPRPTVYLILQQRGIRPSRQKVMRAATLSPDQLVEQLAEKERMIGRLEGEVDRLNLLIEELRTRLGESSPQRAVE